MPEKIDLTGHRYGKLTVISEHDVTRNRKYRWKCVCDCGTKTVAIGGDMRSGRQVSCGCVSQQVNGERMTTLLFVHGLSHAPVGNSWRMMMYRCYDEKCKHFHNYGGRGILVCEYLMESPENLRNIIGDRPPVILSLDRIENSGNYTCGQCDECRANKWSLNIQWATRRQQGRNRRTNKRITIDGVTKCVAEWTELAGLSSVTIRERAKRGWSGKRLLLPADTKFCQ